MHIKSTIWGCIGLCTAFTLSARGQSVERSLMFEKEVLSSPGEYSSFIESTIPINEVDIFTPKEEKQSVLLENGYAQYSFKNEDDWPLQEGEVRPTKVEVIFTKYPKDKDFWLTDYHWLLAKRLDALFALDEALNDSTIDYSIVLQTSCENEFEAMQLFHGIRVWYEPLPTEDESVQVVTQDEPRDEENGVVKKASSNPTAKKILRFMVRERHYVDSSVYKVLDRHPEWQNANLVLDWTGSMYGYGAEALLWHVLNEQRSGIEQVFFFNDGDKKKKRKKVPGFTGGIYQVAAKPASKTIKYFRKVKNKGNGGDSPENDIEALVSAQKTSPNAGALILVADNGSCIRDYALLGCLDKPVHIILCGTERGINHQYINLAWQTGGSIHTADQDISNIQGQLEEGKIRIADTEYILTPDGLLMPSNRFQDRFGYCNRYYRYRFKGKRPKKRRQDAKCYFTE